MTHTTITTKPQRGTLAQLRSLVPKRSLSASDVREITQRQAIKLRTLLGITATAFPIEALGEFPRIELRPDRELPTSAMAFWNGHTWVILVNTSEALVRQRFSICHELHHIICHSTKSAMFGGGKQQTADPEKIADVFAANVLMPKALVKRYWGRGPRNITSMARRFDVSTQAMRYRLRQLGLVDTPERCAWTQPQPYEQTQFGQHGNQPATTYFRQRSLTQLEAA
ncbi:ImmA/IrrE family metallo-endopeptidase [Acidimicrobiales bacterium]|nr:ImmA/IrrE family metallo-endopeptidase [Acidimicrobiales bacterium]